MEGFLFGVTEEATVFHRVVTEMIRLDTVLLLFNWYSVALLTCSGFQGQKKNSSGANELTVTPYFADLRLIY